MGDGAALEDDYETGNGTSEYIRVLRLLEKDLSMGALQRNAIARFLYTLGNR